MIILYIITLIISLLLTLILFYNIYVYFLVKKENELSRKIDETFTTMFSDGYLKINIKNKDAREFRKMYKSVKNNIKQYNIVFEKVEQLKKYSFIKI